MFYELPTNTIGYFVVAIATLILGVRSIIRYRKLKVRLSKHFGISGLAASIGLTFYSVSFFFTRDPDILTPMILIGRLFLDFVSYYQIFLVWYLTPLRRVSYWYLAGPLIPVVVYGYFVQAAYFVEETVMVVGNEANFAFPGASSYIHLFFLVVVFLAGLALGRHAIAQEELRNKVRLFSVAFIYIAASFADAYSVVFEDKEADPTISLIGFVVAGGVFLLTMVLLPSRQNKT